MEQFLSAAKVKAPRIELVAIYKRFSVLLQFEVLDLQANFRSHSKRSVALALKIPIRFV